LVLRKAAQANPALAQLILRYKSTRLTKSFFNLRTVQPLLHSNKGYYRLSESVKGGAKAGLLA